LALDKRPNLCQAGHNDTTNGEKMSINIERTPITEEDLVQFLIDHEIETAEELRDFSTLIHELFMSFAPLCDRVTLH
jgi:hypothetical protein